MSDQASASSVDEELLEFGHDDDSDEIHRELTISSKSKKQRGRPRIPERWTRVVNVESNSAYDIKTYVVATELLVA